MANKKSDKIGIENLNSPGRIMRVDAIKYEVMKTAVLAVVPTTPPGLTVAEIKQRVLPRLSDDLFPGGASVGWWLKGVQLDLEAKKIVARTDTKPLRLHRLPGFPEHPKQQTTADESILSFDDLVALANPKLQPVCQALRRLIASLDDGFFEAIWPKLRIASYGLGPKKKTQHYAYITVQEGQINLGFYHGASLPDTTDLLEGAGKSCVT